MGSFINVITYRLPIMIKRSWVSESSKFLKSQGFNIQGSNTESKYDLFNLIWPPAQCPHCKHRIKPWENIPLLSYFFLRRKCSNCGKEISRRYPITELMCGSLTVFFIYHFGFSSNSCVLLLLIWSLLTLAIIDLNHYLIPDEITIPLVWFGLILNVGGMVSNVSLNDSVMGASCGYLSLWTVNLVFKIIRRKEGMGHGDFKLLAAIGAWLGWQSLFATIIISSMIGAVSGIFMVTFWGKDKTQPVPFGPYLVAATFLYMVWGSQINGFYLTNISG